MLDVLAWYCELSRTCRTDSTRNDHYTPLLSLKSKAFGVHPTRPLLKPDLVNLLAIWCSDLSGQDFNSVILFQCRHFAAKVVLGAIDHETRCIPRVEGTPLIQVFFVGRNCGIAENRRRLGFLRLFRCDQRWRARGRCWWGTLADCLSLGPDVTCSRCWWGSLLFAKEICWEGIWSNLGASAHSVSFPGGDGHQLQQQPI